MIFVLSALLLIWTSFRVARSVSPISAERFWIVVAAICLQLGAITTLGSVFSELNGTFWLAAQVLLLGGVIYFGQTPHSFPGVSEGRLSPPSLALLIGSAGLIALSGISQIATPIHAGDEKMYHASRVIYWIQHQSAFPFETHNDRQTVFTFGNELFFLWPVLLTRSELIGRTIFWLGYPCAAVGQYFLLRVMKLNRSLALLGVLILVSTPLISRSSVGLKPEMWTVVALLGTAYWAVAMCVDPERIRAKCFLLGIFTILSINMRPLALALIPSIVAIPICVVGSGGRMLRLRVVMAGLLCGLVLSSLLIPFGFNLVHYHNLLGPESMRKVHAADLTAIQLRTHAVRLPFLLMELPEAEPAALRDRISALGNRIIASAGAGAPLPMEDAGPWPGKYSYQLAEHATRFSLWGIFWIPTLVIAAWLLVRNVVVTWPAVKLAPVPALTLLAIPLLAVTVFTIRWMTASGVPDRFLIGSYALALPIGVALWGNSASRRKLVQAIVFIMLLFAVYRPIAEQAYTAERAVLSPVSASDIDEPFHEALDSIPAGSRILFVGNQDAPDYPLFSPRTHYSNRVIPWGKAPFEAQRMRSLIRSGHITHVLIQNDQSVSFHWDPSVSTVEMVAWLSNEPGIHELPLGTPHMRLFDCEMRIH